MSNEKRCCPTDAPPAKCHYTPQGEGMYLSGSLDAKAGILLIGDIFGMHDNTKRTVDDLAKAGYLVVMPDFFGEKAIRPEDMAGDRNGGRWAAFNEVRNDTATNYARCVHGLDLLRRLGCQKVAALGLCWGSILTMRLSTEGNIDAASTAHPAQLTPEAVAAAKTPLCVLAAVDDPNMDVVETAVAAVNVPLKVFKQYNALHHGFFGARFDFDDAPAEQQAERADAFQRLLDFYQQTLHWRGGELRHGEEQEEEGRSFV